MKKCLNFQTNGYLFLKIPPFHNLILPETVRILGAFIALEKDFWLDSTAFLGIVEILFK